MNITSQEYDKVIAICRSLFINKMKDYGSAWRILRLPSLTDQIFIKAQRIRSLQENEVRKIRSCSHRSWDTWDLPQQTFDASIWLFPRFQCSRCVLFKSMENRRISSVEKRNDWTLFLICCQTTLSSPSNWLYFFNGCLSRTTKQSHLHLSRRKSDRELHLQ